MSSERAVALVVVGVEALNQLLEARLDVGLGGGVLEVELAQAFPLGALERPRFGGSRLGLRVALGNKPNGSEVVKRWAKPLRRAPPLRGRGCATMS